MFTSTQLSRYLAHISFPSDVVHPVGSLGYLTLLQKCHLAKVPFESLSLHYSKHHLLSLEKEDLYQKIVIRGKGGYCMENNTFFGVILRTLGFKIINVGARVSDAIGERPGGGYMGWNHMANIVTIEGQRYLVDVGFGAPVPTHPLPLISGHVCTGIAPQSLRLEYRSLLQHTDPEQRVWVYSYRESDHAKWTEAYSFVEIEFFPRDYEVMNLSTMTCPQSFFTQTVVCVKVVLNEESKEIEGLLILVQDEVKKRIKGVTEVMEKLQNEDQRVKALEKWFDIVLDEAERKGIIGLATELRGSKASH